MKYTKKPMPTYTDMQAEIYPGIVIKEITFQVTEDCCLNCSYCYQHNKSKEKMTFDIAKKFVDQLLNDEIRGFTSDKVGGVIFDFIGGEPLMEIDLISDILEYTLKQMISLNHPWQHHFRISLCSNGILYFTDKVQNFLNMYSPMLSFCISIDGNKELHDKCRVDFNNQGSYDRAISAVRHYREHYSSKMNSKMTLAPSNVEYTYDAVVNLINEEYDEILLNCVYEKGWTWKHANILYNQLIKLSDYIIDNDLYDKVYISMFEEEYFVPMPEDDNENWCGGVNNKMLAISPSGELFDCIRYMKSSLGDNQEPLKLGSIDEGFLTKKIYQDRNENMSNVTRRSQSTDECFYCPVAKGCAWCSALNYEETGSVNKRLTHICVMHKARAYANYYYWNKLYHKLNINKVFVNYLSEEDINNIITGGE